MRSFASAFIAAALATLCIAAPVNNVPAVPGEVSSIVQGVQSDVHARTSTPGVATIFNNIQTQIQPYTQQLAALTPGDITADKVISLVDPIKVALQAAAPQLQSLSGAPSNVIFAPADGSSDQSELDASHIAAIVGPQINDIVGAVSNAYNAANAKDGSITAPFSGPLGGLLILVGTVLDGVVGLVDGLPRYLGTTINTDVHKVLGSIGVGVNLLGLNL